MSLMQRVLHVIGDYSGYKLAQDYWDSRNQPDAVFIWIPKSAGTSLHKAIGARKHKSVRSVRFRFSQRGIVTFGHMDYRQLVQQGFVSRLFDSRAFKFAFARNPYDRAVSLYAYLRDAVGLIQRNVDFLTFLRNIGDQGTASIGLYNARGLSHCNPQVRWLDGVDVDFIGHIENLNEDVRLIAKKLGIETPQIPHENPTRRGRAEEYYCRESLELVRYIYDEDFKAFGYETDESAVFGNSGS